MADSLRVAFVGLGANCRLQHVPGLLAIPDVQIVGVCNRRPESTAAAAAEYGIPKTYERWQNLVSDPDIDAVIVGTWPYLHCPIAVAALEAGKHVMTEARMAMNAAEARKMYEVARQHPDLVAQVVPAPVGFQVDRTIKRIIGEGFLGQLREVVVLSTGDGFADPDTPLHWRQSAEYSGNNMLALGIYHETLIRWVPDPVSVTAQTQIYTKQRTDPATGRPAEVGTPDSVHVLTSLPEGARGIYHVSGAIRHGPSDQLHLYGSEGTLKVDFSDPERLLAAREGEAEMKQVPIAPEDAGGWRVEEEFVGAIRGKEKIEFTDFGSGMRYMEFTEAVAISSREGRRVTLPL